MNFAIPALDRAAEIIETGLREDNTLEVPPDNEGAPRPPAGTRAPYAWESWTISLTGPRLYPSTLILDEQGRISARILGIADKSTLKALIESTADAL